MPTTSVRRRISLFSRSCWLMALCQTTAVHVGGAQALEDDREQLACDVTLEYPQDLLPRVAALDAAGRVMLRHARDELRVLRLNYEIARKYVGLPLLLKTASRVVACRSKAGMIEWYRRKKG